MGKQGQCVSGRARRVCLLALAGCISGAASLAAEPGETTIEILEEKIEVLAEEIADLKSEQAVPDEADPNASFSGLGPAASKVYRRDRGISIGGYGDIRFRHFAEDDSDSPDVFDALRFVLYTGYKFNDWLVLNSEFELEHGSTSGSGSASVEFLTVDFLLEEEFNIRVGLLLLPMGFLNEAHEPPFYYGAERPEVELQILPTTWRENGVGIFGALDLGAAGDLDYRMYAVNGFDATGFSSSGLRGGRQKGSKALAEHWAFVGRLDYAMSAVLPGLSFGGSVYAGKSGQNQATIPDTFVSIYEVHAQYHGHGLKLRGLFAQAFVDDAGRLSTALGTDPTDVVAKEMLGGYVEIGYDVLPLVWESAMSLEPFFRYEHLDTQHVVASGFSKDAARDYDLFVVGLSFKPIPQVVIKMDYRDFRAETGSIADEFQASIGFVF
ncbi:MAG: hypothetical protein VX466_11990 [Myxococcota bacterium]|nr:hypothetical protein [Myxococcota bacterium]